MKLNFNLDGQNTSLIVESDKPLNKILNEISPLFAVENECLGAKCGNCVVLLNGQCTFSCLVPAFKASGAQVVTYEGFCKTRAYHDIKKAFEESGIYPCAQCIASKTLIMESILRKMEQKDEGDILQSYSIRKDLKKSMDINYITQEMAINKCFCTSPEDIEKVINLAFTLRSRRNGRKS